MGPVQGKELSPKLKERILKLFRQFDVDGSGTIDKSETIHYWKSNFAKLNTEELFKSVDTDNSGTITEEEWLTFWQQVLKSGHTEEEISEELESLEEGSSWVKFENVNLNKK